MACARAAPPSLVTRRLCLHRCAQVGEDRLRGEWNSEGLPTPPSLGEEVDVGSSRLWKKRAGGLARHSPMLHSSNSSSKAPSRSPSRSTSKSNCDSSSKTASRSPSRNAAMPTSASSDLLPPPALSKPSFRRSSSGGGFGFSPGSSPGSGVSGLGPVDAQQTAGPSFRRDEERDEEQEEVTDRR